MQLRDVIAVRAEVVQPDTTVKEAAERMKEFDVGVMPVCEADQVVGVLTAFDITIRLIAEGRDLRETRVRDVMQPDAVYCFEDEEDTEAVRLMAERKRTRLTVLSRDKQFFGVAY
jgi:CBS domain-containing protein